MDTLSEEQQDAVAQPGVKSFDAVKKPRAPVVKLPALPRPAWVGLSGVAGAVLGLVVVLALAPPSLSTVAPEPGPNAAAKASTPRKRPGLCGPEIDAKKANKELAAKLFKEAKVKVADSKRIAAETLEQAINADPFDATLYFELGKLWAQIDRIADSAAAYECVCVVEPNGALCESVRDKFNE